MHVYPLDHKTKDGTLFWTLPKRPPVALEFSQKEKLHLDFIKAYAKLLSKVWGLNEETIDLKTVLEKAPVKKFVPKDSAIK